MTGHTNEHTPNTSPADAAQHPPYGFGTTLQAPFEESVRRVTDALKAEGFGVLTTIDVRATMKAKLAIEFEPYTILGACNPQLAHQALALDHDVGLLLPCNVIVYQTRDDQGALQTRVEIADPIAMLGIVQQPGMRELAREARTRLERALATLEGSDVPLG
ncbi:MAG: DUF302 domain-containing protein [Ktedonobacterales bacterium]|nr:DUF302 domain-containing protein [Ktedonobacterales bacterium]